MVFEAMPHIVIFFSSILLFSIRFNKNKQGFFLNYFFYLLFFSLFYISLPSIVSLLIEVSVVGADLSTIIDTSYVGLYFVTVFFISYFISTDKKFNLNNKYFNKTKQINFILKVINILILCYFIIIFFMNYQEIISAFGNRPLQSNLSSFIENKFKIKALFIIQLGITIYLFTQYKHYKYIFILSPYVIYDLLLAGRGYIFMIFILFFLFTVMKNKIIKLRYVLIVILLIAGIAVLRTPGEFQLIHLLQIFYEFIFTWSTTHIIYNTQIEQDFFYTLNYFFFRIFPSIVYDTLFDTYNSYTKIIIENSPLSWGLAGSIVSESLSFKNYGVVFMYPFIMVSYAWIINIIFRTHSSSGVFLLVLTIIYTQSIFRWSFFELALYPVYVLVFFNLWMIGLDLLKRKKNNE